MITAQQLQSKVQQKASTQAFQDLVDSLQYADNMLRLQKTFDRFMGNVFVDNVLCFMHYYNTIKKEWESKFLRSCLSGELLDNFELTIHFQVITKVTLIYEVYIDCYVKADPVIHVTVSDSGKVLANFTVEDFELKVSGAMKVLDWGIINSFNFMLHEVISNEVSDNTKTYFRKYYKKQLPNEWSDKDIKTLKALLGDSHILFLGNSNIPSDGYFMTFDYYLWNKVLQKEDRTHYSSLENQLYKLVDVSDLYAINIPIITDETITLTCVKRKLDKGNTYYSYFISFFDNVYVLDFVRKDEKGSQVEGIVLNKISHPNNSSVDFFNESNRHKTVFIADLIKLDAILIYILKKYKYDSKGSRYKSKQDVLEMIAQGIDFSLYLMQGNVVFLLKPSNPQPQIVWKQVEPRKIMTGKSIFNSKKTTSKILILAFGIIAIRSGLTRVFR